MSTEFFDGIGMAEDEFWNVIGLLDWDQAGDDVKVLDPAVTYLAGKTDEEIAAFQEILSYSLFMLDGIEYARNIGEESYVDDEKYFSPDAFLYARCVVVANGREFYEAVLDDPEEMPQDMEFEALLYLADAACMKKNGRELDHACRFDFETFSNKALWAH